MHPVLEQIGTFTSLVMMLYNLQAMGFIFTGKRPSIFATVVYEMRWLILVTAPIKMILYDPFIDIPPPAVWAAVLLVADSYWWWFAYKNKDDRWKKRRQKAAAKVKEIAGKLVVVPEPVPAHQRT